MANWSALPDGVIALIARLLEVSEFISFRGTCSSWRLATSFKDFQKKLCPGVPLLMVNRIRTQDEDGDDREFFSFYKKKVITISLPQVKNKVCIGTKGWIIAIGSSGNMSLLNPITSVEIPLPSISDDESYCWVKRAVLSASPTKTSDFAVMIVCLETQKQMNYIGFWKPADQAWTKVETPTNLKAGIRDVSYHKGKFYALSYSRKLWMFDVLGTDPTIAVEIMELPSINLQVSTYEAFFVGCEGTLLVVSSFYKVHRDCSPHRVLELVELDVMNKTCTKITSLANKAVFLGNNEGFCVDASRYPGVIQPNYIYLSNGSYQLAGCEGRMDISHEVKAGMFYSNSHTSPSSSNYCNVWFTPNL